MHHSLRAGLIALVAAPLLLTGCRHETAAQEAPERAVGSPVSAPPPSAMKPADPKGPDLN